MTARCVERAVWVGLLGLGLLVGGCNVFDISDAEPNSVDALLADARTALVAGETSRAVQLLERAFEKDTTDIRVRVELGNALYVDRGIDVFVLRAAAERLVPPSDSASTSGSASLHPPRAEAMCTDEARPDTSTSRYASVSLNIESLRRLTGRQSVVERVHDLVVRGVLERRSEAFATADVRVRRKGLLVGAATVLAGDLIELRRVFAGPVRSLVLDRGASSPRALLACADTEAELNRGHEALCALSRSAQRATRWLRERNEVSGSDQDNVLVGRVEALASATGARLQCSRFATARPPSSR